MDRQSPPEGIFEFPPNALQRQALEEPMPGEEGSLRILEAETGSGKTEMALAWFLRLYRNGRVDGLYFALPTRAAAVQIHERVCKFAQAAFGEDAPEVVRAVPGYTPPEDNESPGIQSDGRRYGERVTESDQSWAAEHPKRYMAGRLVVLWTRFCSPAYRSSTPPCEQWPCCGFPRVCGDRPYPISTYATREKVPSRLPASPNPRKGAAASYGKLGLLSP